MEKIGTQLINLMIKILNDSKWEWQAPFTEYKDIEIKGEFDTEFCLLLLNNLVIKKDNVLTYLRRKYPFKLINSNEVEFHKSKCIQKALLNDELIQINSKAAEIHKLITDFLYIKEIFNTKAKYVNFKIEFLRLQKYDVLLYMNALRKMNLLQKVKYTPRFYEYKLLNEFPTYHRIMAMKNIGQQKRILRYWLDNGYFTYDLHKLIIYNKITVDELISKIKELKLPMIHSYFGQKLISDY